MNVFVRQLLVAGAGSALMVLAGVPAGAQNPGSAAANSSQPQRTIQMVPAIASLDHTLDAKKAKQGEVVTAKLQKSVDLSQEQKLPKDTVLEGHVDQVQASDHKSDSTMVVTFDKVKLKSGQELPIKATVVAMAQPAYAQQSAGGPPAAGGLPASSGGGAPSAAPQGGGGASGSAAASSAPPTQSIPAPDPSSSPQQSQPQRGGVPGVTLKSDIHQQSSATFTSQGKNVHIPDGTQMEIALAVIPAGTRLQ